MYTYAILNENNVCHTVYETDMERDDFTYISINIETYDTNYLGARWDDELDDWEFPPGPGFIWENGEWINTNEPEEEPES